MTKKLLAGIACWVFMGVAQETIAANCPKLKASDAINFSTNAKVEVFPNVAEPASLNVADVSFQGTSYKFVSMSYANPSPSAEVLGGGSDPETSPMPFSSYSKEFLEPYCVYKVTSEGPAPETLTFFLYFKK